MTCLYDLSADAVSQYLCSEKRKVNKKGGQTTLFSQHSMKAHSLKPIQFRPAWLFMSLHFFPQLVEDVGLCGNDFVTGIYLAELLPCVGTNRRRQRRLSSAYSCVRTDLSYGVIERRMGGEREEPQWRQ